MSTLGVVNGIPVHDLDSTGPATWPDGYTDYDVYQDEEPPTLRSPGPMRAAVPSFTHWPDELDCCAPSSGRFCRGGF